jgi:hypothetical protein
MCPPLPVIQAGWANHDRRVYAALKMGKSHDMKKRWGIIVKICQMPVPKSMFVATRLWYAPCEPETDKEDEDCGSIEMRDTATRATTTGSGSLRNLYNSAQRPPPQPTSTGPKRVSVPYSRLGYWAHFARELCDYVKNDDQHFTAPT